MGSMLPYIAAPWILWVLCVSSFFVCPLCTWWVLQPWCPAKLPLHTPSPGAAVEARAKGSGRGATQRRTSWPWNGKIHGAPHVICWNWWNMGICSDLGFCCYILWWSWSLSYVYMYICIYVYHTYIYIAYVFKMHTIVIVFQRFSSSNLEEMSIPIWKSTDTVALVAPRSAQGWWAVLFGFVVDPVAGMMRSVPVPVPPQVVGVWISDWEKVIKTTMRDPPTDLCWFVNPVDTIVDKYHKP